MLKIETKDGQASGMIKGSLNEICADSVMVLHHVWDMIKDKDEDSAKEYEALVKRAVSEGICFYDSAEDLEKKVVEVVSKETKKNKKKISKALDDLVKQLEEIMNIEDEDEDDEA